VSTPHGLLAVVGATATGKSALAIAVAERLGGEIISADAFAVYRGFDTGTAKPGAAERARVRHHLIDVKDPREPYSAGEFGRAARRVADEILERGRLPILCGGTGFYVRAFFGGLFEGPSRDEALRTALETVRERRGAPFLKRMLAVLDPASAERVLPGDASRAIRLLEILFLSGQRPTVLFAERPGERWEKPAAKILLTLPRPVLYGRIAARFQDTFFAEFPEEVRRLIASGLSTSAPAFSAIGYRDTAELVAGCIGSEEWKNRVVRDTRRFAKRQESWFRREPDLEPLRADREDLVDLVVARARHLFS
jgi:tRNA dimethylallyltransferase